MKRSGLRLDMIVDHTFLAWDMFIQWGVEGARLTIWFVDINFTYFIIALCLFHLLEVILFLVGYCLWTANLLIKRYPFLIWWSILILIISFWFWTWNCINRTQKITKLKIFSNSFLISSIFIFFIKLRLIPILFFFLILEVFTKILFVCTK